ncbi:MAG: iron ABC transporter permease [Halanaerobium sp.]|nr:iron ABC transporter permease [Halanaerobium sp.]
MKFNKEGKVIAGSFLVLLLVFLASLFIGRYRINPINLYTAIKALLLGNGEFQPGSDWSVFYFIRLPRLLLVAAVGSVLSLTGATYQSIFRNPLVSPSILGVSAGAGFGVALGILVTSGSLTPVYILAFLFGIISVLLAYAISVFGKGNNIMMLVLSGILVTSLFNAMISILKYLADPYEKLPGIVFWLMGGFNRTGWQEVRFALPLMLPGIVVILLLRWYLNVMSMGEEEAISLGVNARLLRGGLIVVSTFMIAAAVATTGQVTWIGLVVPHIARFLVGANHRYMLIVAAVTGASLLMIMDDLARTLTTAEIPISIITAFIGAPFFAYLLLSKNESGWS